MGEPVLDGPTVPTTLAPTRDGGQVVAAPIDLGGQRLTVTAVSMGNPHAVVFVEVIPTPAWGAGDHQMLSLPSLVACISPRALGDIQHIFDVRVMQTQHEMASACMQLRAQWPNLVEMILLSALLIPVVAPFRAGRLASMLPYTLLRPTTR